MRKNLSEQKFAWLILLPAIILVFGIVIYPLYQTLIYSLKDVKFSAENASFVGLDNYVEVLSSSMFWESLGRTVYFAIASISIELVLGALIALLLNERMRGMFFLRAIIIIPWAIPNIVNAAMWKWIYNPEYGALNSILMQLGLISEYHSWLGTPWLAMNMIIIADVWKMTPFVVIMFLAALQLSDKNVYEASLIDGAGVIRRFFSITLHYLKPMFMVVIVIRTMETLKVFDLIYASTRGGPANGTMVITFQAYLEAFDNLEFSIASTYSYLIGFIILILTYIYIKIMKRGGDL